MVTPLERRLQQLVRIRTEELDDQVRRLTWGLHAAHGTMAVLRAQLADERQCRYCRVCGIRPPFHRADCKILQG